MDTGQSPQEYFRMILVTVVGQAYAAAGYQLEDLPTQWIGGQFRFRKSLDHGLNGFIEYQALTYVDSEWSSGEPSRFRVTVTRTDQPNPTMTSDHDQYIRRDLSALVVEDFGVAILPSANHWWTFRNTQELGNALAEAGHLTIGYGIPFLAGELSPPEN
jgi:hypothetical protein